MLALTWGAWPAGAHAMADEETRTVARELARDGAKLADAGKCRDALELFERAYALVPAPTIQTLQARCLVELGRLIEALAVFESVRQQRHGPEAPQAFHRAVSEAAASAADLRARIPRLKITVSGAGAESGKLQVELDDKPVVRALLGVERPIDPGSHRIVASVPGEAHATQNVSLQEGRSYIVELRLQPVSSTVAAAAPPRTARPSLQRTFGWAALGVGGAGLATGVITALLAQDRQAELDDLCPEGRCPPSASGELDAFRTLRSVSFVGYGVGLAGLGTGAILLLTAPSRREPQEDARLAPWVGWASAGVEGKF